MKFLKVEAEGAEPEVLLGAEGVLPQIEFIAVDVGPERGVSRQTTLVEVFNFLYARGFCLAEENIKKNTFLFKVGRLAVSNLIEGH